MATTDIEVWVKVEDGRNPIRVPVPTDTIVYKAVELAFAKDKVEIPMRKAMVYFKAHTGEQIELRLNAPMNEYQTSFENPLLVFEQQGMQSTIHTPYNCLA